jgi:hypothetical protein
MWFGFLQARATDERLSQSPHALATAQGDELVLFDVRGGRYWTLNAVGSSVWALLAGGASPAEIVAGIRREYGIPAGAAEDPVERDVLRLLGELRAAGLATPATGDG